MVGSRDPDDRSVEAPDLALGDDRRHLGAEAAALRVLVHDHQAVRLPHGGENRFLVERNERPEIDDLEIDPFAGEPLRRVQRGVLEVRLIGGDPAFPILQLRAAR